MENETKEKLEGPGEISFTDLDVCGSRTETWCFEAVAVADRHTCARHTAERGGYGAGAISCEEAREGR
jgi:hypothetical protein